MDLEDAALDWHASAFADLVRRWEADLVRAYRAAGWSEAASHDAAECTLRTLMRRGFLDWQEQVPS